jgi:hypothetical protein
MQSLCNASGPWVKHGPVAEDHTNPCSQPCLHCHPGEGPAALRYGGACAHVKHHVAYNSLYEYGLDGNVQSEPTNVTPFLAMMDHESANIRIKQSL